MCTTTPVPAHGMLKTLYKLPTLNGQEMLLQNRGYQDALENAGNGVTLGLRSL
jgi:hypothetical protein